jgi:hypothetical protein
VGPVTPQPGAVPPLGLQGGGRLRAGRRRGPASIETLAAGWFPPGTPPELSTGRTTAAQIARLIGLDHHPELPPDLD